MRPAGLAEAWKMAPVRCAQSRIGATVTSRRGCAKVDGANLATGARGQQRLPSAPPATAIGSPDRAGRGTVCSMIRDRSAPQRSMTRFVRRACRSLPAVAALALCLGHAHAQGINEPEVEKGQRKLESVHIIQNGFNGGLAGSTREVHSGAFTQGITDIWQVKGFVAFDRLDHQGYEAVAGVVENTFAILDAKKSGGLGLAWFTGIAVSLIDRETNALIYGPILRLGAGPTSLVLNPFLETTFGRNEEGTALLYAWQLKHEARKGLFLGLEGYGRHPGITGGDGRRAAPDRPLGRLRVRRGREAHADLRDRLAVRPHRGDSRHDDTSAGVADIRRRLIAAVAASFALARRPARNSCSLAASGICPGTRRFFPAPPGGGARGATGHAGASGQPEGRDRAGPGGPRKRASLEAPSSFREPPCGGLLGRLAAPAWAAFCYPVCVLSASHRPSRLPGTGGHA